MARTKLSSLGTFQTTREGHTSIEAKPSKNTIITTTTCISKYKSSKKKICMMAATTIKTM